MSPRAALFGLSLAMVAVGTSCARSVTLGSEEAVEVLVLDGVDRTRASCIVSALDGELDLTKVTGLDVNLDDDELALLARISSQCAPALAATAGVVGGSPLTEADLESELQTPTIDVEAELYRMVEEGLDPTIVGCLLVRLRDHPEPAVLFADDVRFSEIVVDCRDQLR
ncbi:MAG: hypothetical protein R2707_07830 [Acidimicrobiales bacterium]